jgi:beta-glucanase (GH16 family)
MRRTALLALALLAGTARGDDWTLVWSDEFATDGRPDPAKWGYEEGFVRNNEAQYYTPKNARVERGVLVIEARKEHLTGLPARPGGGRRSGGRAETQYTSASLTTRGKASWTYGKIEARAKIPTGRGTWPAIWLLGTNVDEVGWPRCGEIDVMENVGFDPDVIHANIHTELYNHVKKTNKGSKVTVEKPYADFHVYALEWGPEALDVSLDGRKYFTFANEGTGPSAWPFDRPHYLILNLAIGGDWGGQKGIDEAIFPQRMEVDYVRVYQKAAAAKR